MIALTSDEEKQLVRFNVNNELTRLSAINKILLEVDKYSYKDSNGKEVIETNLVSDIIHEYFAEYVPIDIDEIKGDINEYQRMHYAN